MTKIDEVRYSTNISNASIIGIGEVKPGKTILSSELEIDGYDLMRLDLSRRGGGVAVILKVQLHIITKTVFTVTSKVFLLTFICQSYWVSYIDHPIN